MLASVSASTVAASSGTFSPGGRGLEAELARSEVKLSDWTHCVSAKTPQGKEKIAEIGAQVDEIKARMKAAEQASSTPAASRPAGAGPLGHSLDVYA